MKTPPIEIVEQYRIRSGPLATDETYGNNGAFRIPVRDTWLQVIASDGAGWEHVSVSHDRRCPTWDEMCTIKQMFFRSDEIVVQFHPREQDYVNCHCFCLHLWRPIHVELPTPPTELVGPRI